MSETNDQRIYDRCLIRVGELEAENEKLREQMERLVTLLRVDCDIDASWDGLRRFWSIGLTEDGCLMRDRACKAEAENAKLREELADAPKCETCEAMLDCDECLRADGSHKERRRLSAENAKLRELVRDMCKAFIHGPCYRWCEHMPEPCNGDKCQYVRRMHELGVDA